MSWKRGWVIVVFLIVILSYNVNSQSVEPSFLINSTHTMGYSCESIYPGFFHSSTTQMTGSYATTPIRSCVKLFNSSQSGTVFLSDVKIGGGESKTPCPSGYVSDTITTMTGTYCLWDTFFCRKYENLENGHLPTGQDVVLDAYVLISTGNCRTGYTETNSVSWTSTCRGASCCTTPVKMCVNKINSDDINETNCLDGKDNDFNGLIDCQDPDCENKIGPQGQSCQLAETNCNNNLDDDGDNFIDFEDFNCYNTTANNNNWSTNGPVTFSMDITTGLKTPTSTLLFNPS